MARWRHQSFNWMGKSCGARSGKAFLDSTMRSDGWPLILPVK